MSGIAMARASWGVLREDRKLMIFPAVSFLLTALVSIGFFIPFWGSGAFMDLASGQVDLVMIVVGFLYYLTVYSVVIFCNVAVVAGALMRLEGGEPTLGDGFSAAFDRLPAIIGYAAIAANFARLAGPALPLTDIEDYVDIETGSAWVAFTLHGERRQWTAAVNNDWVDDTILRRFADLLAAGPSGLRFTYYGLGQDCLIGCATPAQRDRLRSSARLKFDWLS